MIEAICKKTWLSPLLGVFFVAVGLSGTLMLFHACPPMLRAVHEWIGLGLVITGVLHLTLNWKALVRCFDTRGAVIATVVGTLLVAFFIVGGLFHGDEGGEHERRGPQNRGEHQD